MLNLCWLCCNHFVCMHYKFGNCKTIIFLNNLLIDLLMQITASLPYKNLGQSFENFTLKGSVKKLLNRKPCNLVQAYCLEQLGYSSLYGDEQEYARFTTREYVTRIAQMTINNLCDYTRRSIIFHLQDLQIGLGIYCEG